MYEKFEEDRKIDLKRNENIDSGIKENTDERKIGKEQIDNAVADIGIDEIEELTRSIKNKRENQKETTDKKER